MTAPSLRLVRTVLVVVAAALATAPAALAGSYDVVACDAAPGGANNSWVGNANNPQLTVYAQCPSGGNQARGIVARNAVQPSGSSVGQGALSWWLLLMWCWEPRSPEIKAVLRSCAGTRRVGGRALKRPAEVLTGCPPAPCGACVSKGAEDTIAVPNSQTIYIEALCAHGPCPTDSTGDPVYGYLQASANLYSAVVTLQDDSAPGIASIGGSLWSDGWKRATQTLAFHAEDNSGIKQTAVLVDGQVLTSTNAWVRLHTHGAVSTGRGHLSDQYAGDQRGVRSPKCASPSRRPAIRERCRGDGARQPPPGAPRGDGGWRQGPQGSELVCDAAAESTSRAANCRGRGELCPASGSSGCVRGSKDGAGITAVTAIEVPRAGDWKLTLWLRDQAGNETQTNAAAPVRLRYDDEAPSAVFAPIDSKDPTRLVVQASDGVSGIGSGSVEIRPQGSETWASIAATVDGGRLVATLPDEQLPDGVYELRGHAVDRAGNERTTTALADGTAMTVTLPVRAKTALTGGRRRVVKRAGRTVATLQPVVSNGVWAPSSPARPARRRPGPPDARRAADYPRTDRAARRGMAARAHAAHVAGWDLSLPNGQARPSADGAHPLRRHADNPRRDRRRAPARQSVVNDPRDQALSAPRRPHALLRNAARRARLGGGQGRGAAGARQPPLAGVRHHARKRQRALVEDLPLRRLLRIGALHLPRSHPDRPRLSVCGREIRQDERSRPRTIETPTPRRESMRRPKLSYSNVAASVALFVALGGTSYAALSLPGNSVGSRQIRTNAVGSSELQTRGGASR